VRTCPPPDLDEADVRIGELWQLGSAVLQVCQPRNPCWKIDERFGADGMAGFIAEHLLTGWYWRVVQPGHVSPGDPPEPAARRTPGPDPARSPAAVAGPPPAPWPSWRAWPTPPGWPAPGGTRSCSASPGSSNEPVGFLARPGAALCGAAPGGGRAQPLLRPPTATWSGPWARSPGARAPLC
jgi:hypothetical protein